MPNIDMIGDLFILTILCIMDPDINIYGMVLPYGVVGQILFCVIDQCVPLPVKTEQMS